MNTRTKVPWKERLAWRSSVLDKIEIAQVPAGTWECACHPCCRAGRDIERWHALYPTPDLAFAWARGHLSWHKDLSR